jgi:hypothetical protein
MKKNFAIYSFLTFFYRQRGCFITAPCQQGKRIGRKKVVDSCVTSTYSS